MTRFMCLLPRSNPQFGTILPLGICGPNGRVSWIVPSRHDAQEPHFACKHFGKIVLGAVGFEAFNMLPAHRSTRLQN
jgi:hypothetical protein